MILRIAARLLAILTLGLVATPASAQLSEGGLPPSLDRAKRNQLAVLVPEVVMPPVDEAALRAEDAANAGAPVPFRFGANIAVDLGADTDGVWETLADGSRVWRLAIHSPGARSINLMFDRYLLPPGAQLFVHDGTEPNVLGAFTDRNQQPSGVFATTLLSGDAVVIEYVEPARAAFNGELHLSRVTHGYRDVVEYRDKLFGESGACNNNVSCAIAAGWEQPISSVVMLVVGGSGFCTGAIVNNTLEDRTPYLLTANHCYSDPASWVFWFNWESNGCGNPPNSPAYDSLSGAALRARRTDSDFCLVELNDAIPDLYQVSYAGWDASGVAPTSTVGIHHPAGDIKKFSIDDDAPTVSGYFGAGTTHWRVGDWDDGTTEGGSSGSPLFDASQRIIGQLHGGGAACGNDLEDYYGRLSVSWDGASSSERLQDWLDPTATGILAIDAYAGVFALNAALGGVVAPGSAQVCTDAITPSVELLNLGSDALISALVTYTIDGGAPVDFAWTGDLVRGESEVVALSPAMLGPGAHAFDFSVSAPNGGIDENPANDTASAMVEVASDDAVGPPVAEDFEMMTFPPTGFEVVDPEPIVAWERTEAASGFGMGAASARMNNFDEDIRGDEDVLVLPPFDLRIPGTYALDFDVAYARYDASLSDELEVLVSDDCGGTWTIVYSKAGTTLATAPDHTDLFVPSAGEWRTESVDLSAYAGEARLVVAFNNISGWGNAIYVDNIQFTGPVDPDADMDGVSVLSGDCDDDDPDRFPGNVEVCDGVDNDCDLLLDGTEATGFDACSGGGDGGLDPVPTDKKGGCGCSTVGSDAPSPMASWLLSALVLAVFIRRRVRRRTA